jgi:hypothetical protein
MQNGVVNKQRGLGWLPAFGRALKRPPTTGSTGPRSSGCEFGSRSVDQRTFLVAIAGILAIRAVNLLAAQSPDPKPPAFEVASVKPDKSDAPANSRFPMGPGDAYVPGSLFSATNQSLIVYLRFAYKLGQGALLGLPGWIYDDRFDIEARAPGNPTKDQMRLMMQSLLADRFKLISHTERQTTPVFNLVLAKAGKTGPQLRPHSQNESCSAPSSPQPPVAAPVLRIHRRPACSCRRWLAVALGQFPPLQPAEDGW